MWPAFPPPPGPHPFFSHTYTHTHIWKILQWLCSLFSSRLCRVGTDKMRSIFPCLKYTYKYKDIYRERGADRQIEKERERDTQREREGENAFLHVHMYYIVMITNACSVY